MHSLEKMGKQWEQETHNLEMIELKKQTSRLDRVEKAKIIRDFLEHKPNGHKIFEKHESIVL